MSWLCLCIIVLLPFHALFTTWLGAAFGNPDLFKVWKEIIILGLIAGCTIVAYKDKELKKRTLVFPFTFFFMLYIALAVLRTAHGYVTGWLEVEPMIYGIVGGLRYIAFFLVTLIVSQKASFLHDVWLRAVLGPAAIVILFGLAQQFLLDKNFLTRFGYGAETIPAFQSIDQKTEYARAQSSLRGPNPLGAYLTLILTAITAATYRVKTKRFLGGMLGVLCIILLFFSYSRSAWLGAVFSLLAWAFIALPSPRLRKQLLVGGTIALAFFAGFVIMFRENDYVQNTIFHTNEASQSAQSSNEQRAQALSNGLSDVRENPLGGGLGSAGPASARSPQPKISENYYIQIAQEAGVAGLLAYLAAVAWVAVYLWRARKDVLAQVLLSSLTGISAINVISHAWMDDTLSLLWWGLAGVAIGRFAILKPTSHAKKTNHSLEPRKP